MKPVINIGQMALISLMTAIICIIAPFSLILPFSPIPFSLGTLAIYFGVIVLGMKHGVISVSLYILLGFAGLPVFSNFTGGAGKLLGPTGGFIVGYLFIALILGFFVDKWRNKAIPICLGAALSTVICYLFGTVWLAYQASMTISQAFLSAIVPFLPGDIIKLALAVFVGFQVRKRLVKTGILL